MLVTTVLVSYFKRGCITWLDRRDMVIERNSWVRSRQPISPADDTGDGSDIVDIDVDVLGPGKL